MKNCTAAIGSLTIAMKALAAIEQEGLAGKIVKLDPSMTRRGCAYGIEYSCDAHKSVRSAFTAAKIPVTAYIKGGGGEMI
jgi:hypothetical protein